MIKKVEFEITPTELEEELWGMDSSDQSIMLALMSRRLENEYADVCMQLENVKDALKENFGEKTRQRVVVMLELMLTYVRGARDD